MSGTSNAENTSVSLSTASVVPQQPSTSAADISTEPSRAQSDSTHDYQLTLLTDSLASVTVELEETDKPTVRATPHCSSPTQGESTNDTLTFSKNILESIRRREFLNTSSRLEHVGPDMRSLTCAVCLDVYFNPKFLPCHHTFCALCIQEIAKRKPSKPFKCPTCRKETVLQSGGVDALQNNFYLKQTDLDRARHGQEETTKCTNHPQQELDLFCKSCEKAVCFKCVITKHKEHCLVDVVDVAQEAATCRENHLSTLDNCLERVFIHAESQKQECLDFEQKQERIKKNLRNRHDTIVAAAKKHLRSTLDALDKETEEALAELRKASSFSQAYLSALLRLQNVLHSATTIKSKVEIVEAERDLRVGYGSREAIDTLLNEKRLIVRRPVLSKFQPTSTLVENIRCFFGEPKLIELPMSTPTVTVIEEFCCGDAFDTEIFSLCPKDNGTLSLSYERRGLREDAPSEGLDGNGRHQYSRKEAVGMATWKSRGNGKGVFVGQLPGLRRTYSKGQHTESLLRLDHHLNSATSEVKRERITHETPYKSVLVREASLICGTQRAFDTDESEQIYVILEESQSKDSCRQVLLFHKSEESAKAVYRPPFQSDCSFTDVCFANVDGLPVLLVTDEWNDAIHIVDYQGGELQFSRLLAPGFPCLVQPIASNVDLSGKVWVACRGGNVITIQPYATKPSVSPLHPTDLSRAAECAARDVV